VLRHNPDYWSLLGSTLLSREIDCVERPPQPVEYYATTWVPTQCYAITRTTGTTRQLHLEEIDCVEKPPQPVEYYATTWDPFQCYAVTRTTGHYQAALSSPEK
jgi:hypothetical protein